MSFEVHGQSDTADLQVAVSVCEAAAPGLSIQSAKQLGACCC